jgi:hypothetical protein
LPVHRSTSSVPFEVAGDGTGLAGRAGLGLVTELADRSGLSGELSHAVGGVRRWVHDPNKVLRDVTLTMVDGGDALRHMGGLASESEVFGEVGSPATACRTVWAVAADEQALGRLAAARKIAHEAVWAAGGEPPVVAAAGTRERGEAAAEDPSEPLAIDVDATISIAHSNDQDGAGATYKGTWGFHPLLAYLDRGDGARRRWPAGCGQATPARTTPPTTSRCCPRRAGSFPSCPPAWGGWCAPTLPAPPHAFLESVRDAG